MRSDDVLSILRALAPGGLSRYDLLLAVIPLAFLLALLVGAFLSTQPETALLAASVVGALAVIDGLFRNPPTVGRGG